MKLWKYWTSCSPPTVILHSWFPDFLFLPILVCVHARMCLCVYVCVAQRSVSVVFLNHLPPYFLRQDLSLDLELTDSAQLTGHQTSSILTQVFMHMQQALYQLSLKSLKPTFRYFEQWKSSLFVWSYCFVKLFSFKAALNLLDCFPLKHELLGVRNDKVPCTTRKSPLYLLGSLINKAQGLRWTLCWGW